MSYGVKLDGASIVIKKGSFTDYSNAMGEANLVFVDNDGGYSLPSIGDQLHTLDYYSNASSSTATYEMIVCSEIRQQNYGFDDGTPLYSFECRFDSGNNDSDIANGDIHSFISEVSIVSMKSPVGWSYCDLVTFIDDDNPPVTGSNIGGEVDQKINKIVTEGNFKIRKIVDPFNLSTFYSDYLSITGKLNTATFYAYDVVTGITFSQGQLLCGSLEGGGKDAEDNYIFDVVINFRLINDKNAPKTADIERNDWQYVYAPTANDSAGWMAPIQVNTGSSAGTVPTIDPFPYVYCASPAGSYSDGFQRIYAKDYKEV